MKISTKTMLVAVALWISNAVVTFAQTTPIHSLTILIDFPDEPGFTPRATFDPMFNQQTGYTGFGWNGSVREYWNDVTNGEMDYTTQVIGWFTAPSPRATYEEYEDGGLDRLLTEVLEQIEGQSFTGLSIRPGTNEVYSVNTIVQGRWTESLRPVAAGPTRPITIINDGQEVVIRGVGNSVTDYNDRMSMSYPLHEAGHQFFHWTEYYQRESRIGSIGHYGLMGFGGINRDDNPTPPNPGLRHSKGWINNVINLNVSSTTQFTANSNDLNQVFKYTNPANPREYYLIEPYTKTGRYSEIPDEGLAIWYVDEEGGLSWPRQDNYIKANLVFANGNETIAGLGTSTDLFHAGHNSEISDFTTPASFRWKDGGLTGLHISGISAVGATMTFTVNANGYIVSSSSDASGTISPSGTIRKSSGQSQQFELTPDLGYELDQLLVDGNPVQATNNGNTFVYTLYNISSNKTVAASFEPASSGYDLPSPWQTTDFGTNVEGESYFKNGKFHLKSYGWDFWNNVDNGMYVYQPLDGDGEIVARVYDQDAFTEWAKSGVMIRESLTATSKHAFMSITPFQGPAFQYRVENNNASSNSNTWNQRTAKWVKLVREGNTFTGYYSVNGTSWVQQGSATINMAQNVYVGLASAAGTDLKKSAFFDEVTITTPNTSGLLAQYNVPRSTGLPSHFGHYYHVYTIGNGPDLSNVHNSIFNWNNDTYNSGLYQFSLETTNGNPRWYSDVAGFSTNTFASANPSIVISNSGFNGLDGEYYVNLDGNNVVLVEKTGAYALYFSASSTPPSSARTTSIVANVINSVSPNPFEESTTVHLSEGANIDQIDILDVTGRLVETILNPTALGNSFQLGNDLPSGMYLVRFSSGESAESFKIIKK